MNLEERSIRKKKKIGNSKNSRIRNELNRYSFGHHNHDVSNNNLTCDYNIRKYYNQLL